MASLKQDAKRAAQLLNSQELAGWDLAELCARRILSTSNPADVADQRERGRVSAREWAELVTISGRRRMAESTAQKYARCWRRYGEKRLRDEGNAERSFAEHMAAASGAADEAEDRIARFQNRDKGSWEGREQNAPQTIAEQAKQLPAEHKAAVVREMLVDPQVAIRVMRDSHTRRIVGDAREQVAAEIEGAALQHEQASPVQRELARAGAYFEIGNHLRLSRFHAAEAARMLQDLDDRDDGWIQTYRRDSQDMHSAVDWFDTVLEGGKVDDDALARFLEGGAS